MHTHEMAVHFDRVASSREVEGALALVELDQYFPLDIVNISPLHHLREVSDIWNVQR